MRKRWQTPSALFLQCIQSLKIKLNLSELLQYLFNPPHKIIISIFSYSSSVVPNLSSLAAQWEEGRKWFHVSGRWMRECSQLHLHNWQVHMPAICTNGASLVNKWTCMCMLTHHLCKWSCAQHSYKWSCSCILTHCLHGPVPNRPWPGRGLLCRGGDPCHRVKKKIENRIE